MGGWPTPSPIYDSTGDGFIMGADGVSGCGGRVKQYDLVPGTGTQRYVLRENDWGQACSQGGGFAGNFTVSDGYVYWVDTKGVLYGRRLIDGANRWDPINLPHLLSPTGAGFTNTSPAVDKDGNLYITLRNFDAKGNDPHAGATGTAGAILSIDPTTGAKRWATALPVKRDWGDVALGIDGSERQFNMPESANTNPLVIDSLGAVLLGDVNGNIQAFDMATGAARRVFTWGKTAYSSFNLLQAGEAPMRASAVYSQLSGAGTDPMAASGYDDTTHPVWLAVGANYMGDYTAGRLVLIPMGQVYNLKWAATPTLTGPDAQAQYTLTGSVALEQTTQTLSALRDKPQVEIDWFFVPSGWSADQGGAKAIKGPAPTPLPPGLAPGTPVPVSLSFALPNVATAMDLVGLIDGVQVARFKAGSAGAVASALVADPTVSFSPLGSAETNWDDNLARVALPQGPVNLAVSVSAPGSLACAVGQKVPVTVTFANQSGRTVSKVPWSVTLTYSGGSMQVGGGSLGLPAGSTSRTVQAVVPVCGETMTYTATVNLSTPHAVDETTYADNTASAAGAVAPPPPPNSTGSSITVIVPQDCEPNPDPSSRQPCLNYPNLIIPGW